MLMQTYGLRWTSPAIFPERAQGYVDTKGPPAAKLVKQATEKMSQEIKAQKLSQNEAGAYWAKHGRLPTGTWTNHQRPVYLLQKSIWMQDPETKQIDVVFGDRYDMDQMRHIPSGISASGEPFEQNDVSSEEQSLLESAIQGIHERRKEVRDMRGCTSTDNCFGLPTYVCFLPIICCLGGCCYDQWKQKQIVSRVAEEEEEYIKDLNATVFMPKGLSLKAVISTYYTLQYIGRNEIRNHRVDGSDQTFQNVVRWKWEITPITLRWLELRRAENGTDSPEFPLPSETPVSLFGTIDPKSPKQLSSFKDTYELKVGMDHNYSDLFT